MKLCASLALLVIAGFVASSDALPARKRMVYYQQPAAAEWFGAVPSQRIMYMQYVQPGRTHARSTQAASALVAGDTIATGTYLKDCDHVESDVTADDINAQSQTVEDSHVASSVAEAYPEEAPVAVDAGEAEVSNDAAKVPRDFNFLSAVEEPVEAEVPAPAPIAPVVPAKRKVTVELDQSHEQDEEAVVTEDEENENAVADDVEEDDEEVVVPVKPVLRRPAAKKPAKAAAGGQKPANKPAPLPAGSFFPIDFGGASGAVAIANSFSTGEGGAATSHAVAYGSPESVRARVRPNPSRYRH